MPRNPQALSTPQKGVVMLTRAGTMVERLFPELTSEPAASPQVIRRSGAVGDIRLRRETGTQDLSFGARPFILCGLPIRRLPSGVLTYKRRNGKFFLEIVGHPDHGVPFGQDRLVLLWLATVAVRQQNPVVQFGPWDLGRYCWEHRSERNVSCSRHESAEWALDLRDA